MTNSIQTTVTPQQLMTAYQKHFIDRHNHQAPETAQGYIVEIVFDMFCDSGYMREPREHMVGAFFELKCIYDFFEDLKPKKEVSTAI